MSSFGRVGGAVSTVMLLGSSALLVTAGEVQAAGCQAVVEVQSSVPIGIHLTPRRASVPYGGCVQFSDQAFGPPVTITVAGGYHVTLNYGESTTAKTNYSATVSGAHAVTAEMSASKASGQITVGPRPAQSPSPSPSPSPAASQRPTPRSSTPQSTGPQVAPTPRHRHRSAKLVIPIGKPPAGPGVVPTPGVVPSVAGSPPGPLQTTTPALVVAAGPLEPPSPRALGLPAALAALVLIGVGAAVVRVMLAEPAVDGRRSVGGTA
jgi:hypothetical protein